MSKQKTKVVRTRNSVTIHFNGSSLIINNKHEQLYDGVIKVIEDCGKNEKALKKAIEANFGSWKQRLKSFTSNTVDIDGDDVFLKGSNVAIPQPIVKALKELEATRDQQGFLPLIRFWKKLSKNPSANSRKQLYSFMQANKMSITETGDLIFEKGVKITNTIDEFVDCHRGTVPYVIGQETSMPRDQVQDDPTITCASGLHVAPPAYVRQWYTPSSTNVIIECTVNPIDVVSVPHDYNSSKVRVCRLKVVGYSDQENTRMKGQVFKMTDFITEPPKSVIENSNKSEINMPEIKQKYTQEIVSNEKQSKSTELDASIFDMNEEQIKDKFTARKIVEIVNAETGRLIVPLENKYLKNKNKIAKRAVEILAEYQPESQEDDSNESTTQEQRLTEKYSGMTAKQIVKSIQEEFDVDLSHINIKNKQKVIKEAVNVATTHEEVSQIKDDDAAVADHKEIPKQEDQVEEKIHVEDKQPEPPLEAKVKEIRNEIDLESMRTKDIVKLVKSKFNESIGGLLVGRNTVISRATELFEQAGYDVKS